MSKRRLRWFLIPTHTRILTVLFMLPMLSLAFSASACRTAEAEDRWQPIPRRLPPAGISLRPEEQRQLTERVAQLRQALEVVSQQHHDLAQRARADVEVFLKGVDFALELGEFYDRRDVRKANDLLDEVERRIEALTEGESPWISETGLVVRGFYSRIDHSVQPYGLVIPDDLDVEQSMPLYVWLHGRGDKTTDLHFIHQRMRQTGQIAPPGALVLHPFGRHCLGFKSAGETDVLEAVEQVCRQYPIDKNRIVLIGFSMGGAGAWHLGAHYADRWVAVSPGAGFAETAQYQRLRPEDYPPRYEQILWGVYDVPLYVRNLFNVPVFAYSGERDRQIQAARVMEEAYIQHGRTLPHLIGPDVEHAYHPDTLAELLVKIESEVQRGRDPLPQEVFLQTRTLRYARQFWVEATGLQQHWEEARIDARLVEEGRVELSTANISQLRLWLEPELVQQVEIDGQSLDVTRAERTTDYLSLVLADQQWRVLGPESDRNLLESMAKRPGQQGPIDDAFLEPFLVVTPSSPSAHPQVEKWQEFELQHLRDRWRGVFRGELPEKPDTDVTDEDLAAYHLILWGDPSSNLWIRKLLDGQPSELPLSWTSDKIVLGAQSVSAANHVPVLIYPSPFDANRYVVINSGPTFREDHDRTNSLQNPKLPDWAILNIDQPPTGSAAGEVIAADFFDEAWQVRLE